MNNLNPEGNIMPIDDETAHDIKWAFVWAIAIVVVFLMVLYILGKVYPPAETSIRAITGDTIYIWRSGPNPLIMNDDSVIIYFQDDSIGALDWNTFDTMRISTDTAQPFGIPKDFRYWRFDDFDTPHEITYPKPEPKIIKIQRRIKNARSTRIQWK